MIKKEHDRYSLGVLLEEYFEGPNLESYVKMIQSENKSLEDVAKDLKKSDLKVKVTSFHSNKLTGSPIRK